MLEDKACCEMYLVILQNAFLLQKQDSSNLICLPSLEN